MSSMLKPRRSVLYLPGSNRRALDKARSLPADSLIFDLEDAVAPDAKATARQLIVEALIAGGYGLREVVVRINALDSTWGMDDIRSLARHNMAAIVIPKAETAEQVQQVITALDDAGGNPELPVWVMAETPRGILNIQAVAASHPRLTTIVMGTSDLAKELRVPHTADRAGLVTSLSLCVLAARACGLTIIDGVQLDLSDDSSLEHACQQCRELGFDGKSLIHPKQIATANRIFAPSEHELTQAHQIIDAWCQAQAEGKAVAVCNGRLIEKLHVDEAHRILAVAEAIASRTV